MKTKCDLHLYLNTSKEKLHHTYSFTRVVIGLFTNQRSLVFPFYQPLYRDAWEKEKANVNVPADTPLMLQSKINAMQISNVTPGTPTCFTPCSLPHQTSP